MTIDARFILNREDFKLDAELSVPAQGITALFGPSGCGKTTLLRAIAGLEKCPGGYLKIGDRVWQQGNIFVPPHQRSLGYVFQEASLFPHLSVQKNLEYGYRRIQSHERKVSLDQAISLLGITHLLNRTTSGLSGGERQRVAIARALLTSPRLLLMDEPLAALDLNSKAEILPYLERLHEELEIPIFYVSHAPDEIARLADHLVLLDKGSVSASGPISQMLTRADLPLSHEADAAAVIEARVCGYDKEYHLTQLDFAGGRFTVTQKPSNPENPVRLRILARDVSLTLEPQSGTSILNIFPATVQELAEENVAQITVRLDIGGAPILSRITRKSAAMLDLKPGKAVYAQVKSIALL
ncbi:molybdenum ABC transporter ATP-binding protein [Motiliproteus sp. MSK22-1]|nr:molybdenum ABC transporter ATP-binding protein [Motiliproteus sp. MSK22-1]